MRGLTVRSTVREADPDIKTRLRLGTNPGNISSKDHQKRFFNNVCPHCEAHKAPPQGVLLWNQTRTGQKHSILSMGYPMTR
jgi:hypothetical protein